MIFVKFSFKIVLLIYGHPSKVRDNKYIKASISPNIENYVGDIQYPNLISEKILSDQKSLILISD
jgi:hypothetical protein